MTMPWGTIRDTIKAWAESASGLKAVWTEEQRPFIDGPHVLLNVISVAPVGVDETRAEEDLGAAVGEEIVQSQTGMRRFTVSCSAQNFINQTAEKNAAYYLERLRTRLRWPSAHATFVAAGIAVVGTGPLSLGDYDFDGRRVSLASFDIMLQAAVSDADTGIGYIETVEVSSAIEDEAGDILPAPPNLVDEEMP